MARSSYVTSPGYRSSVASRSHRWAGVEYPASSRSSSACRLRSVAELAGIRRAYTRNQSPGREISPHTPPRSTTPATVSAVPASSGRQRCRAPRARRIRPMTVISAPVRSDLRVRLVRTGCMSLGSPYLSAGLADRLHATRFRRCERSLIAASRTPASRCVSFIVRLAPRSAGQPRRRARSAEPISRVHGRPRARYRGSLGPLPQLPRRPHGRTQPSQQPRRSEAGLSSKAAALGIVSWVTVPEAAASPGQLRATPTARHDISGSAR
jgi:hypothetical protein